MRESSVTYEFDHRFELNTDWLLKLRWVAVGGQLLTICVVAFGLGIRVELVPLLVALGITAATNALFALWFRRVRRSDMEGVKNLRFQRAFSVLMFLDLAVLTYLLYYTGGHANPFAVFYFVNLALSGILISPKQAWFLAVLSIVCFSGLFFWQVPLQELLRPESLLSVKETGQITLGQWGMIVSFSACALVIVYFATRLNTEVRRSNEALRFAERKQARSDQWESLGTLAAGAAHELATPLTTVAVLSKEIAIELDGKAIPQSVEEDVTVIQTEIARCRDILTRMSIDAGHITAERPKQVCVPELVYATLAELPDVRNRLDLKIDPELEDRLIEVPLQSVCLAIRALLQNATDASQEKVVDFRISNLDENLTISIQDRGEGMSAETLQKVDNPFFSTKEIGRGMGLGRFLARSVIERLGGSMTTISVLGEGTLVKVSLPVILDSNINNEPENTAIRG